VEESTRVAAYLKMNIVMQNQYFKDDDFSGDPIKKYLKPYTFTSKYN